MKEQPDLLTRSQYKGDLELSRDASAGDKGARRILAERLYDRIRTTVRYISADHRDQDDWVQLALVEILRSVASFRGESTLESWAHRITIRVVMRQLKKSRKYENKMQFSAQSRPAVPDDTEEEHRRIEMRRCLAGILGTLSLKQRTAVVMKLVYGYSVEEIAAITDAPPNTVRNRLRNGRRILREKVSRDPVFSDWVKSRIIQ